MKASVKPNVLWGGLAQLRHGWLAQLPMYGWLRNVVDGSFSYIMDGWLSYIVDGWLSYIIESSLSYTVDE